MVMHSMYVFFFFKCYGDHRDLHLLTHAFPTRRSSDLMLDLPALASYARRHDLVLACDNTWGSGYVYRPLALGAHISVVAGTKYVGGHSDLMLGAEIGRAPV